MSSNPNLDPVQAMLAQTSLQNTLFAANSRYYQIPTKVVEIAPGKTVAYLQRRFLPSSASFQILQQYTVTQGVRLDNIAAQFMGDPTLFWRICDANDAMRPEELTETAGTRLRITLPQGITGGTL
jgi:hypothetical protein